MAKAMFAKESEEFQMFGEFHGICKRFWIPSDCEEYWDELMDEAGKFSQKYHSVYARHLALGLARAMKEIVDRNLERTVSWDDSRELAMFKEFYKLCKDYWIPEERNEYWKAVIDMTNKFSEKYASIPAKHLALEFALALEELFHRQQKLLGAEWDLQNPGLKNRMVI